MSNSKTDLSFVRTEMVSAMPPPVNDSGVVGWMRRNLFSSVSNTILTLIGVYILYLIVPGTLKWVFFDAVWSGQDRLDCATTAQGGELPEKWKAACWPYVGAYFKLFIYGRYPDAELWRVNLTLFMFFAGLIPLAMPSLPFKRENLIFMLGIFPVAAFVLLTGGNLSYGGLFSLLFVMLVAGLIFTLGLPGRLKKIFPAMGKNNAINYAAIIVSVILFALYVFANYFEEYLITSISSLNSSVPWLATTLKFIGRASHDPFSGNFWVDYIILSGLVVGAVVLYFRGVDRDTTKPAMLAVIAMAILGLILFVMSIDFGLEPVETSLWGGFVMTLVIAVTGIVAALPLGILLALGRRSQMPAVSLFSVIFIEFWRGVPLITVLFMSSVMLPLFLPDGVTFDKLLRALIGVALFSSAYMAEVVRGGMQAIPKGQYEGAMAVGLNYWQSMRMIILPQALKIVIPGIVNTFIGLFKDTTLVSIIGLLDFLGMINLSHSDSNWATPVQAMTSYVFCAFIFFLFCFGMSRYSIFMEDRLNTSHR
ncbi:MAG: amino acid ABC transporter permease [Rhizobiaceae bacterium]|nr:amino acid ABC transporter permease [Rhizobiaceae bacterium]